MRPIAWRGVVSVVVCALVLGGCGGGQTVVLRPPVTKTVATSLQVLPDAATVEVPQEAQETFQSKLMTLLYQEEGFKQGPALSLRYRFVQFNPGSQFARWLVGPLGGEGSLTIEVRYLDAAEQEVARVHSTGSVKAGIAGGPMLDALDRAAAEIATYTKQHFR